MKRKILRFLKRIWLLNFVRRVLYATRLGRKKIIQAIKWGFTSNEDTNYTYHITQDSQDYLAQMISVVTNCPLAEVEGYFSEILNDEEMNRSILDSIENSPLRKFADKEIRLGRRLGWYAFVRITKPKVVIETGIDKGLGSVMLCSALLRNLAEGHEGRYFGTDINPQAGYFLTGKYTEVGEVLYGDSIESLKDFKQEIDIFINDSDHSADYEAEEYEVIKDKISSNALILGDNSHCTNKLSEFSKKYNRKFLFYKEETRDHWYAGAGLGISYV